MKQFDFLKHSKIYYIISAAIVLVTVIATVVMGLNVDIEFKGGTVLTYSFEGEVDTSDIVATVKKTVGSTAKARISQSFANESKNVVLSIAEEVTADQQQKITTALEKDYKDKLESTNNKLENFNGNTMPKYEKRSYRTKRGLWSALIHKKDGWIKRRNEDLTN